MKTFYTIGFDGNYKDLPDRDIESEAANGAIRRYVQEFPASVWVSARCGDERRVWSRKEAVERAIARP